MDAADAFVFVMPEYNHGFNAPLKNAIDFLHQELARVAEPMRSLREATQPAT